MDVEQRTWTDEDLAALYDRFFGQLFDVAIRVLGSEGEAGSAVGRAFSRAFAELRRKPVDELRPWLYGLLAAELPHKRPSLPTDLQRFARVDSDRLANPERLAREEGVVSDVWRAASALSTEDYVLLDLQLRHGLRDPELGRALGLDLRVVDRRLERLRDRLEGAVASHISPVAVFAALAPVDARAGLKEEVWASLKQAPARASRERRRAALPRKPVVLAAVIALLAAAATAGAFYAARGKGVHDPKSLHSTSHSLEQGSANPDVEIAWTPSPDASGYSVSWSAEPETPDKAVDLPAAATGTTGHLKPGTSWFNLRTLGKNGRWTSTIHVGPFLILPDTVVPETRITAGPHRYGTAIATFEFESSEKSAMLECSLDGATFQSCASPKTYTGLVKGKHSFRVRSVDAAGNADPTPARREWQVDAKAPNTKLTEAPAEFSKDSRFEFASSETHSSFECKVDGGAYEACSSPKSYPGLADGPHRFRVRAIDRAGNPDLSPANRSWTVDTSPPETSIDSGPPHVAHKGSGTFTVSSEAGATFECRLDGHGWGECGQVSGLSNGKHVMRARAKDRAGNVDPSPAKWEWRIDLPPETRITDGPGNPTSSKSATFRFTSPDTAATFQCRLDGHGWTSCASGKTYTGLSDGSHTFKVRAKDAAGTNDPSPAQRTWTVDTDAPNTTITAGPKASTKSKSATFSFSASESGSTFECRLDGGAWHVCSSPRTYSGLHKGAHVFRVRAIDEAGNRDATPDALSWTVN
jgi:DNA-directed RNA polymerase specialized sigma24 family protein